MQKKGELIEVNCYWCGLPIERGTEIIEYIEGVKRFFCSGDCIIEMKE